MGALVLNVICTALLFIGVSVFFMKTVDFDDIPYLLACTAVVIYLFSAAVFAIGVLVKIWLRG